MAIIGFDPRGVSNCHPDPELFAFCHSEGVERPKNLTLGRNVKVKDKNAK